MLYGWWSMKVTFLLFTCLVYGIKSNKNGLRIFGGRNATEGEFPYVVKMMYQRSINVKPDIDDILCSCSILTQTWTLTAAHCATGIKLKLRYRKAHTELTRIVIEYQNSPKSESAYSEVLHMFSHPFYKLDKTAANDMALVNTQPVLIAKYGKLSPLDYTTLYGQEVFIVGYGKINRTNVAPIPHVPHVLEAIVKECYPATAYPAICYAPPCSKQTNVAKAICHGDSGGPTIHASGIVAVSTWILDGRNCDLGIKKKRFLREKYHKGYDIGLSTPTSSYIDWISSIIKTQVI